MKKFLSITTIISSCIVATLLILLLFDIDFLGEYNNNVIVTLATIAIGGLFSLNSVSMMKKNKILGVVSFVLILASICLIVLFTWISIDNILYFKITISIGLFSILFNIIVSSGLNLGKKYLLFQILTYLIIFAIDILSTLMIFNVISLSNMLAIYLTLIIIAILGIILLKVFASKLRDSNIAINNANIDDDNYVRITKDEYSMLVSKAKLYDEMTNKNNKINL